MFASLRPALSVSLLSIASLTVFIAPANAQLTSRILKTYPVSLQDETASPSDTAIQQPASPIQQPATPIQQPATPIQQPATPQANENTTAGQDTAPAITLGLSDAQTSPLADATPAPSPQVATLGRNNYSGLVGSPVYASPLISLAGIGATAGSSVGGQYFGSSGHQSLLQTPEMFGDFRRPGSNIGFDTPTFGYYDDGHEERPEDFPTAASFSGLRISENNYALPQDRVWFGYNHYHNAFAQAGGDLNLDRFVFGVEKTFFGGNSSVELRLPVAAGLDPNGTFGGTTSYAGGSFGNLSAILKRVLYADDERVFAAGLGIEMPTGSQSHAFDTANGAVAISVDPAALYLTPYLGAMRKFNDTWFANGFIQIDVPTSGDELTATIGAGPTQRFLVNQPSMLEIDLGLGAWLLAPTASDPSGLSFTSELHIATAVSDMDQFTVTGDNLLPNVFVNVGDSIDTIVNATNGLQATFANGWSLRTGVSVPLLNQRIFDTEILVQANKRL